MMWERAMPAIFRFQDRAHGALPRCQSQVLGRCLVGAASRRESLRAETALPKGNLVH